MHQGSFMRRFGWGICCVIALLFCIRTGDVFSQSLTSEDGLLEELQLGTSYQLLSNPNVEKALIPSLYMENGYPIKFVLNGFPITRWRISFRLPSTLRNKHGDSIDCTFNDSSMFSDNTGFYLNPHSDHTIVIDSTGIMNFYLGISVDIPSRYTWTLSQGGFVGKVYCVAENIDTDMQIIDSATYMISNLEIPDWGPQSDGSLLHLSRGKTYSIDPKTSNLSPINNGEEQGGILRQSIVGDPRARVFINYGLPKYLIGDKGDSIPCSFSSHSAYDSQIDSVWNPHDGYTMFLNDSGFHTINLGITVTIPYGARSTSYSIDIITTVSYIVGKVLNTSIVPPTILYVVTISDTGIPNDFILYQNYPNPFNPSTTIAYGLPTSAHVTLNIYNMLGQRVIALINENQIEGYHEIKFNSENLPSGIYCYQLKAENFIQTKKLTIIK
jgi:hypothetical protein